MKPAHCIAVLSVLHSWSVYPGSFGPASRLTRKTLRLLEQQSQSTTQNPLIQYRGRLGLVTGGFLTSLCLADDQKKTSPKHNTLESES